MTASRQLRRRRHRSKRRPRGRSAFLNLTAVAKKAVNVVASRQTPGSRRVRSSRVRSQLQHLRTGYPLARTSLEHLSLPLRSSVGRSDSLYIWSVRAVSTYNGLPLLPAGSVCRELPVHRCGEAADAVEGEKQRGEFTGVESRQRAVRDTGHGRPGTRRQGTG